MQPSERCSICGSTAVVAKDLAAHLNYCGDCFNRTYPLPPLPQIEEAQR